jgi:hypothetical protein
MPVACLSLVVCLVARAQADNGISEVGITTEWNATNGVPDPMGYQQVFTVTAAEPGIQSMSIAVSGTGNPSWSLSPDTESTHWEYDSPNYGCLSSLRAVYPTGNYTLTIGYSGGTDTVTLPFNPTQPTPTAPFILPD